jgi:hypothetical protein
VLRQKVLRLSRKVYHDFNDTHFTEKLREEAGLVLSRETVRKIRREATIEPKRGLRWMPSSQPWGKKRIGPA